MNKSSNAPWWITLICLAVICAVFGFIFLSTEAEGGHGSAHRIASMSKGDPASRHDGILWIAWVYGSAQIILFVLLTFLGVKEGRPGRQAICWMGLPYLASFFMVMATYRSTPASDAQGLPESTAWMLWVLAPLPIAFVILYAARFSSMIYNAEDHERFQELLAKHGAK